MNKKIDYQKIVSLNSEQKEKYLFDFRLIEERADRLKREHDMIYDRFQSWEMGINQLWADINTLKLKLDEESNPT